ncbi:MAG: 23S rRNA (adenine(2503)-C(2))-methyltransferase RlmN [Aquificae bacterium]|nr:23S rRNA (adenine(2503)-C(2))-methyltransferase RlmN [Aquificota bacterium]
MKFITGYTLSQLKEEFTRLGLEKFRASQVLRWVYKKFVTDFSLMTDLSKEHREFLSESFSFHPLERVDKVEAPDAVKYLFKTHDGHIVETVLIKERDHLTLCVSSQIGCAVGCTFCATALDGLKRNLSTEEIVDQFLQVQKDIDSKIRNVVFMGMGEPLANYDNVRKAVEIMVSPWGLDLSKRRVTISTSGLVAQLRRMSKDPLMSELNLAVSLNSPDPKKRLEIMPLTKTNTLEELMEVLKTYPLPRYRRITLEYVLIKGVNDSDRDARELVKLIGRHRKRFKVNLIPFNPDPNLPFERPSLERVLKFQKILWDAGISTFVRFSKGADVFGACGQLRSRRLMLKSQPDEKYLKVVN